MSDLTTVDIFNIAISASVPILITFFGWVFNTRLKSIDQAQWQNRKIIELRLDVFKSVSPKLNSMFCYCMYVGDWKRHSPVEIVQMKRETDREMHVYRYLLGSELFERYNAFIATIFQTFNGPDHDARIRTAIESGEGNRKKSFPGEWIKDWERFIAPDNLAGKAEVRATYEALMNEFRACIGLRVQ